MPQTSTPPPDSDRIAALNVRISEIEERQRQRTWPGAVADGLGVVSVAALGALDKIDGVAAAVIIALVLGARIPTHKRGGIIALLAPFARVFSPKFGL